MPEKSDELRLSQLADGLMNRRAVTLIGEINNQSVGELGQRMLTLQMRSNDPITLIIDSGGGDMDPAFRLCDAINHVLTAEVHGVAVGSCGSAATFIMLSCAKRIGTPYSRFLIHSGTRSGVSLLINQESSANIELLRDDVKAVEETVLRFYMSRLTPQGWTGGSVSETEKRSFVQALINRGDQRFGKWLSADEAVEAGLIQSIVHGKLDIFGDQK